MDWMDFSRHHRTQAGLARHDRQYVGLAPLARSESLNPSVTFVLLRFVSHTATIAFHGVAHVLLPVRNRTQPRIASLSRLRQINRHSRSTASAVSATICQTATSSH